MKKITSNIAQFFYRPQASETLAAFRIAASSFALIQFFVLLPDWMTLYGPDGLLPWQVTDTLATSYMPTLTTITNIGSVFNLSALQTIYGVTAIYSLSLVGLLVGYKTRLMGILAWLSHLTLNTTGHFTAYGVETFAHISLFYCAVLPVNVRWSMDALRKPVEIPSYLVTLSIRIIQLHLCIMYCASGIEKALGEQWWNGEAIWIALQQDQFHQVNTNWMAHFPWVPKLLCWGTLALEIFYPLGILWRRSKKIWLAGILMMHLGIALFLGLQLFGALMFLLNLSVFGENSFPGMFSGKQKKWWRYQIPYNHDHVGEVFNPL